MPRDTDGDGIFDYLDTDSDSDGIPDSIECGPDPLHPRVTNANGTPDYLNTDSDGDGIPDSIECGPDPLHPRVTNANGIPDYRNPDSDGDGILDAIERGPDGLHPRDTDGDGIPDYRDTDSNNNGIPDVIEVNADGSVRTVDSDGDGLPDYWETFAGLNPDNPADAATRPSGNPLTYLQIFRYGLNPKTTDTDGDGLSDFDELFGYGTNPLLKDTDGDGLPDKWEMDNGLDPRRNDANEDRDFDFLTNAEEYNGGVSSTSPSLPDTDGNGVTDYQQRNGGATKWDALYDRNDRLLGVRHERGASFGYRYDANGNPVRQAKLGRDSDGDGLPDAWEFAYGLNPNSTVGDDGPNGDPDGDGWTNLQEFRAATSPRDAMSKPGTNGAVVSAGGFQVPFVPTRFVEGVGQLDGAGTAEIVVGADGNPSASVNVIRVYAESGAGWLSEDVPVGSYGVTSIVVGQLAGKSPAIYVGLRKIGGTGRVVELLKKDGVWLTNVVAESQSETAEVIGIRTTPAGTDLALNLATRIGPDGALYRATFEDSVWKLALLSAEPSRLRGMAALARTLSGVTSDRVLRTLDAGGIQDARPPAGASSSIDEFNGNFINLNTWATSGVHGINGSHSFQVLDGTAQIDAAFSTPSGIGGRDASAVLQLPNLWANGQRALLISVTSAGSVTPDPSFTSGDASVIVGGSTIYSSGSNRSDSGILLNLLRMDNSTYYRRSINGGPWSAWDIVPTATTLSFRVSVTTQAANRSATASIRVDYVRYLAVTDLLATPTATDFPTVGAPLADAAYRASTGTWYFQMPSGSSWRDAQSYALARGGNLATVDSADTNTWLQGKFSGDFWLGYYRDFSTSPWRWAVGSVATYTSWLAGQPGSGSDQVYVFANGGTWSSATGVESKRGVFEVKATPVEAAVSSLTEPLSPHRLQWSGRNLSAGFFNPGAAGESSVIESFIEDNDHSDTVTVGDEFVVAELLAGANGATTTRTLSRRPLTRAALSQGYGLAAIRPRSDASEMLVTAEPDGQVFMWSAPTAGASLQSQSMSLEHLGKSWHALEPLAVAGSGDGLVGLRVDPAAPQRADVILFSARELAPAAPVLIQQSPPSARILSAPSTGGAAARIAVRVFDSDGNPSRLEMQFQNSQTSQWQTAALATIDGVSAAANPSLTAPPAGATHQIVWSAAQNLVANFKGTVLLRARATDFADTGSWSDPAPYLVDLTPALDTDGDGMPDEWEVANGLNPSVNDAAGDRDGDGSTNLEEFQNGTNPNDVSSAKFTLIVAGVGATVAKAPDQALYDKGSMINVAATPVAEGRTVIGWAPTATLPYNGGYAPAASTNPLPVVMDTSKTLTAYAGLPLADALDETDLAWTTGGHALWVGQSGTTADGLDAAQATGLVAAGNEAWLETSVVAPGTLSWREKIELVTGGGSSLQVLIGGVVRETITASIDWTLRTAAVSGVGATKVRWRLVRQAGGLGAANEAASVDTVSFSALGLPTILTQPANVTITRGQTATLTVAATGAGPFAYQWYQGAGSDAAAPIAGATQASYVTPALTVTTSYWARVTDTVGSVDSAAAVVTVAAFAPAVALTSESGGGYSTTGGSVTLRVRATYTGQTPMALGVTLALPAGWSFTSYSGPSAATSPEAGSTTPGWTFATVPANELIFSFTVNYPAGLTGVRTVTGSINYGEPVVNVPFAALGFTPVTPPTISTTPTARAVGAGAGVTFMVGAAGTGPFSYQWRKNGVELSDGVRITGTATATLTIAAVTAADAGTYSVTVSNAAGSISSGNATLSVAEIYATHTQAGRGFLAGGTVTIANTITYEGALSSLGWSVLPPSGWSYVTASGSQGDVRPVAGDTGLLEWAWTTIPASPVVFSYTLHVPAGASGPQNLTALLQPRQSNMQFQVLVQPDPLLLEQITFHSADGNHNNEINLSELLRVIELYNTRNGTVRTGAYVVDATNLEDGFATDPVRASTSVVTLAKYHTADANRDGVLSLIELLRVIELYNYRDGTVRTGRYHADPSTEDGFAPGP